MTGKLDLGGFAEFLGLSKEELWKEILRLGIEVRLSVYSRDEIEKIIQAYGLKTLLEK